MILKNYNTVHCTGTLINNTAQNLRSFILTANHCVSGLTNNEINTITVRFKFWKDNPYWVGLTGAQLLSRSEGSDFALLEMNSAISADNGVFYLGWSRTTALTPTIMIHHPTGDIMKITRDNANKVAEPLSIPVSSGTLAANSSWRVNYNQTKENDFGTTQGGSSGSPLINTNHQITGTLTGGNANGCAQKGDTWYGRFDVSWTGGGTNATRLSNWLDPNNRDTPQSGATFAIDGSSAIPCNDLAQDAWVQPLKTVSSVSYTYTWSRSTNINIIGSGNSVSFKANGAQPVGTTGWIECEIRTPQTPCGGDIVARSIRKNITWVNSSPSTLIKATDNATNQVLSNYNTITKNSCKNFTISFDGIPVPKNASFNWTFSGNTTQFWTSSNNGGKTLTVCCYGVGTLNANVQVINGNGCITGLSRTYTLNSSSYLIAPVIDEKQPIETVLASMRAIEEVRIFPNPTFQSQVIVQIPPQFNLNNSKITFFDIYGKALKIVSAVDMYQTLDISNYNTGIYLIEVNDGISRQTNRLMIYK
jgi:lysyl endopeptidase